MSTRHISLRMVGQQHTIRPIGVHTGLHLVYKYHSGTAPSSSHLNSPPRLREREREREMAAEEGQVIGCHNVAQWTEHCDRGKQTKKLIVVDFTASWCGPCRFIAPILSDLAKKYPHIIFLKIDVDELKDVAKQWSVEAMPTFVFLKDGAEVERIVGAKKDELIAAIVKHGSEVVSASA